MKDCRNCVWLLYFISDKEVECIKEKFGRISTADFRARENCELWETFEDALARLQAANKKTKGKAA